MDKTTTILARELIAKTNKLIIQSLILIQESKEILRKGTKYDKNIRNQIDHQKTS